MTETVSCHNNKSAKPNPSFFAQRKHNRHLIDCHLDIFAKKMLRNSIMSKYCNVSRKYFNDNNAMLKGQNIAMSIYGNHKMLIFIIFLSKFYLHITMLFRIDKSTLYIQVIV